MRIDTYWRRNGNLAGTISRDPTHTEGLTKVGVKDNTAVIPKSTNEMVVKKALRLALENRKRYIHGVCGASFSDHNQKYLEKHWYKNKI